VFGALSPPHFASALLVYPSGIGVPGHRYRPCIWTPSKIPLFFSPARCASLHLRYGLTGYLRPPHTSKPSHDMFSISWRRLQSVSTTARSLSNGLPFWSSPLSTWLHSRPGSYFFFSVVPNLRRFPPLSFKLSWFSEFCSESLSAWRTGPGLNTTSDADMMVRFPASFFPASTVCDSRVFFYLR